MSKTLAVEQYVEIGQVPVKKFIGGKCDPSRQMTDLVTAFVTEQKRKFNATIADTFELKEGEFTKFEFFYIPEKAFVVENNPEVAFEMPCDVDIIYVKQKSVVYFSTHFAFRVKPGCFTSGTVRAFGGKDHQLEEIYFAKITSVQASHEENVYKVINDGCFGTESNITVRRDGFTIRSGENFKIWASANLAQELAQARKMINTRVAEYN